MDLESSVFFQVCGKLDDEVSLLFGNITIMETTKIPSMNFHVISTKIRKAYVGKMDSDDLEAAAEKVGLTIKDYVSKTCQAFRTSKSQEEEQNYSFALNTGERDTCKLSWKEIVSAKEDVKLILGTVNLEVTEFEKSLEDMMVLNVEKINCILDVAYLEEKKYAAIQKETENLQMELHTISDQKISMESDLFSKFKLALDSKKKYISHLEQKIEDLRKSHTVGIKEESTGNRSISSADDEYGGDTDVDDMDTDDEQEKKQGSRRYVEEHIPSTSHAKLTEADDDASDEEEFDMIPKRKPLIQQKRTINTVEKTNVQENLPKKLPKYSQPTESNELPATQSLLSQM